MNLEYKTLPFEVLSTKDRFSDETTGTNLGVFEGHLATFTVDEESDKFVIGCFRESIENLKGREDRPIRMYYQHDRFKLIGGFPIEFVREDEKGLFVQGNINLDTQQGREAWSLMKQGVLRDMSIGFKVPDGGQDFRDGIRYINKANIWEGSLVGEPANRTSTVSVLKGATPFINLPVAEQAYEWDETLALKRVQAHTECTGSPSAEYKGAFLYCDRTERHSFDSYQYPIADVIDGKLTVVPQALMKAAEDIRAMTQDAFGQKSAGASDTEQVLPGVVQHSERYFAKMGTPSPFDADERAFYSAEDVRGWTAKDAEQAFFNTGCFSRKGASAAAALLDTKHEELPKTPAIDTGEKESHFLEELKELTDSIRSLVRH